MKSVFNLPSQHNDTAGKAVVAMERISEAFRVLLWDHAKKIGLSPVQMQVLIFILYHNENLCNVSYLAKEFNVTKPTMSDAVRVLMEKRLVEKNMSDTDKRAYSISLTIKGRRIAREIEHFANPIRQILTESDDMAKTLFSSLSKLIFELNKREILSVQRICYGCRYYEKLQDDHYCHLLKKGFTDYEVRVDCAEYELHQ